MFSSRNKNNYRYLDTLLSKATNDWFLAQLVVWKLMTMTTDLEFPDAEASTS